MNKTFLAILLLCLFSASIATAEIYKWRDENGKLHFSDTPPVTVQEVKAVNIKDNKTTGVPKPTNESKPAATSDPFSTALEENAKKIKKLKEEMASKRVSASDYTITSRIDVQGNLITISGRIGSGPKCDHLTIDIFAVSEQGNRAHITDSVSFSSGFGSTLYEGSSKTYGNNDQDWKITSTYVKCRD